MVDWLGADQLGGGHQRMAVRANRLGIVCELVSECFFPSRTLLYTSTLASRVEPQRHGHWMGTCLSRSARATTFLSTHLPSTSSKAECFFRRAHAFHSHSCLGGKSSAQHSDVHTHPHTPAHTDQRAYLLTLVPDFVSNPTFPAAPIRRDATRESAALQFAQRMHKDANTHTRTHARTDTHTHSSTHTHLTQHLR